MRDAATKLDSAAGLQYGSLIWVTVNQKVGILLCRGTKLGQVSL